MNYLCIRDRAIWRTFRKAAEDDRREMSAQAEHILCEYLVERYGHLIADPVVDGSPQKTFAVTCAAERRFNDELRKADGLRKLDEYLEEARSAGVLYAEPGEISAKTGINLIMLGRLAKVRRLNRVHKRTKQGQRWVYDLVKAVDWAAKEVE